MESKAVSEVKGVTVTMDLREALRFLEDPSQAQDHVRGQLKGHGLDLPEGNGRPRKAKAGKASGLKCNRCGKPFKHQAWLDRHIKAEHPETLKG